MGGRHPGLSLGWAGLLAAAMAGWSTGGGVEAGARAGAAPEPRSELPLRPGYRAFSFLPADVEVARQARAGDRIDAVVVFDAPRAGGKGAFPVAARILSNLLVLSGDGAGTLTVALNPNELQYLALALEEGRVSVRLRAYGDVEMGGEEMAAWSNLSRPRRP